MDKLKIDNSFQKLPADSDDKNISRQVYDACYSYVTPTVPTKPSLLASEESVAEMLGISDSDLQSQKFLDVFSGNKVLENTRPFAMCYGGHQFGHWAGQLGDGRAINLFEVVENEQRWMLQLKGAGPTPYSRSADGYAVLRSSVREFLCSEAIHHLGIPTTRVLSLVTTGDSVLRDMMYDGNAAHEPGAIVCRVAPSFIRFGSFEIFTVRGELETLKKITDYTLEHFFPELGTPSKETYLQFLRTVCERTMAMVVEWQRVGFVHGVMNTDNMSILGLTIDYGPYGWLEDFNPNWTPNTTDSDMRRYTFGNQPRIAMWNLVQLASALLPLIEDVEPVKEILEALPSDYRHQHFAMMGKKLGLQSSQPDDEKLIQELDKTLALVETDMTIFYRSLASHSKQANLEAEASNLMATFHDAFYVPDALTDEVKNKWKDWITKYTQRLQQEELGDEERKEFMNQANPKYVLRNYMAQKAIEAAESGDNSVILELQQLLRNPYDEQPDKEKWYAKRPEWARHKVGCSMLSCSS